MDRRTLSPEYSDIAWGLIDEMPELAYIKESDLTITFLSSEHRKKSKNKIVHAICEKVNEKYKWGIPADFTITVFEPNVAEFNEEQIRILLFHELLHIGKVNDAWTVVPHDLEDFKLIIDKYGTNWSSTEQEKPNEEHHSGE